MHKKSFINLVLGSLVVFSLIAWFISVKFSGESLGVKLQGYQPWWIQVLCGILVGLLCGSVAKKMVDTPYFRPVSRKFIDIIGPMRLSLSEIWIISLCAGIGEELLFRGAVQPLLGIWLTSLLFVFLHGYLSPFNGRLTLYGIFMVVVIAFFGYLAQYLGLMVVMIAHTLIDVILLKYLTNSYQGVIGGEISSE